MKFEYDEAKSLDNIVKHGMSFEEAQLAFAIAGVSLRWM
jgi:uncharacterized DUF497 family protein